MITKTYYVNEDVNTTIEVTCPECNRLVRTQANAMDVWILTHELGAGNCQASGKPVRTRR